MSVKINTKPFSFILGKGGPVANVVGKIASIHVQKEILLARVNHDYRECWGFSGGKDANFHSTLFFFFFFH